ncbi:hypothetical protein RB9990 [Rhodopirellula baltica SH 1]|uniref:Uncharacterized protein n=1 Tax=Rhodopirellula baltica (strain DSM 10527 / NCIMB 13988 / SH1) TaxID=243090 RepID=Q7UKR7_RHOBA|nr:hypothetical protein RB9990 [Rhodopirellula baltica SH 1]
MTPAHVLKFTLWEKSRWGTTVLQACGREPYQPVDLVAYRMTTISRWALAPVGV